MSKNYTTVKKQLALGAALFFTGGSLFAQVTTQTYTFTGTMQSFTVPSCVSTITLDVKGAQGGTNLNSSTLGGLGGSAYGIINVTAGDVLNFYVGGSNGFNGGGVRGGSTSSGTISTLSMGGMGGGASDVRFNGTGLNNRVIVAGGGGGAGGDRINTLCRGTGGGGGGGYYGGGGGSGWPSASGGTLPTGGTQSAGGGAGISTASSTYNGFAGVLGIGGNGGNEDLASGGQSGGAAALPGGTGGGATGGVGQWLNNWTGQSGAGGSSYVAATLSSTSTTSGNRSGDGVITIMYTYNGAGVTTATPTLALCSGSSATLTAASVVTYTWNTGANTNSIVVSPTVATSYTVSGTNSIGCISNTVINVSVNSGLPVLSINNASNSICAGKTTTLTASGATTYTWTGGVTNAVSFTPAATSGYTVTGANACGTTTAATSVTVNPLPPVTASINNPTVCSGGSVTLNGGGAVSYTWSGGVQNNTAFVPAATGNYTVTGTSANGCTATAVTGVTVLITPTVAPVVTPTAICIGTSATLTATGATNYTWTPGPGSNTLGATNVVSPSATTTYTLLRTNGACPSTATITLVVNPLPTFVATAAPGTICAGTSGTLNAVGAISYTWLPAGFNSANVTVYPNSTTVYTLVASNGSCTANQTVSIVVNSAPNITINSSSTVICQGASVTMTASGAATYTWLATASSPSATTAAISVTPSISTLYTVSATNAQGCSNSITQVISVNSAPNATATVLNPGGFICAGDVGTITATGNAPISYSWNPGASTAPTFTAQPPVTTVYTLTASNPSTGCQGTSTVMLTVNIATFNVSGAGALCKGTTTVLSASGAASSYSWNTTATTSSITITPLSSTNYYVTGFNGNCQSTQTVAITVNPIPNVVASAVRPTICRLEPAVLNASGAVSYSWSANAGGATTAAITLTPNVTTSYTVVGTDANGCSKTAVVTQFVNACLGIEQLSGNVASFSIYPNPNNGNFTIMGQGTMHVNIVNQTGQIVKTMVITETSNQVNVSGMAKGIYFIVAEQDGNTSTKKIVVTE